MEWATNARGTRTTVCHQTHNQQEIAVVTAHRGKGNRNSKVARAAVNPQLLDFCLNKSLQLTGKGPHIGNTTMNSSNSVIFEQASLCPLGQ